MTGLGMKAVMAIVFWQVICFVVNQSLVPPFEHLLAEAYVHAFGDLQSSFARFDRMRLYSTTFLITVIATSCTALVCDYVLALRSNWMQMLVTIVWWEVAVFAALICAYECGVPYRISQFMWYWFGPPADTYSFQAILLPYVIAWVLCSVPIGIYAVTLHLDTPTKPTVHSHSLDNP